MKVIKKILIYLFIICIFTSCFYEPEPIENYKGSVVYQKYSQKRNNSQNIEVFEYVIKSRLKNSKYFFQKVRVMPYDWSLYEIGDTIK